MSNAPLTSNAPRLVPAPPTTSGPAPAHPVATPPAIPAMPTCSSLVRELHARMTLEEKLAQLVGYWLDQGGSVVAPMQGEMAAGKGNPDALAETTRHGIGHYTRVYGTRPVEPLERAAWLWGEQRRLKRETRLGIPALVHEECLTGLAAWQAATFPTPLAWGASFNPVLVREAGQLIGESMRTLGVHQGLAPVLDVIRDPRWGRVDECISEDPYVVGTIGTAFVQGLQSTGVHATAKHFLGYSASQAGRNHGPVHAGPREIADVFLPPFEMAIRDGGIRSVMNSYSEIDGAPVASSPEYLTGMLRDTLGFDGVVVADYFSVAFLAVMHGVARDLGEAAQLALRAGIDVELPTGDAYLEPLAGQVRAGLLDEGYVDRAVLRVLAQKEELGLLEADAYEDEPPTHVDLDSPQHREVARRLAEESVILLSNDGTLPLDVSSNPSLRVAVLGPNADSAQALQGCYSFANHVLASHPDLPMGFEIATVLEACTSALRPGDEPGPDIVHLQGCEVEGDDTSGFAEAAAAASSSDVAIVVVGDRAGLFGRGTVGEGNDVDTLELPGVQRQFVEAILATGTPVVLILLTGRPYAIDWALDGPGARPAAVLQAFFPGEGGALAIADIVTGRVNPSGRLPVSLPRSGGAQPYSYLHPLLGGPSDVTVADSTPLRPFGFGLSYTTFSYSPLETSDRTPSDGVIRATVTVTNTGQVAGADVVQLYGHDVHASLTRPSVQLIGYARVLLEPGESATVSFGVPATRFAFTNRRMVKVVEPGEVELWVASHAATATQSGDLREATGGGITSTRPGKGRVVPGTSTERVRTVLTGDVHQVTPADQRIVSVEVDMT